MDRVWAATVIAAGGRGMAGRTRARAMRQARREQRLLLRLQAVVRGHGGRVVAEARRAEAVMEREWRTQMAIVVQCAVRQRRARAAHLALYVPPHRLRRRLRALKHRTLHCRMSEQYSL